MDSSLSKRSDFGSRGKPVLLQDVSLDSQIRFQTTLKELDRVYGGGIVPGSVTLIGGDPGIGKSTLSLQMASLLSAQEMKILYVSAEESVEQTKMRADRLCAGNNKSLYLVSQINLETILNHIKQIKPSVVIVDSIQVIYHPDVGSSSGSVSQVRECASILTQFAKSHQVAVLIIGHVTKEGAIAGPRILEHVVDTVLYFEGERYSTYRILRAIKNRFGSTNEIGVFEMTAEGLKEVHNPSQMFLSERSQETSGSVVVPIIEGTRPFLVEIQGLVARASFGVVRQKAQGFEANRLALLAAVLEKKVGLNLRDKDIFLNVAGGVRVIDPAADLGVIVAVASALLDKPVDSQTVFLGEVGLSSEVRSVSQIETRLNEADKLGFHRCVIPRNNCKNKNIKKSKISLIPVETVKQALDCLAP